MSDVVQLSLLGTDEMIALDAIIESPYLPRKTYNDNALDDLGGTLNESGLMHPILVSRLPDGKFELQAGSRRIRSARKMGYTHISARVTDKTSPREIVLMALAENVQRQDLEPIEEAASYLWLHKEYGMDVIAIAAALHKQPKYVRDRFKVLDTAPEVQQLVADGKISLKTGVLIATVPEGERQVELAREVMRDKLDEVDVRNRIRESNMGVMGSKPNYASQSLTVSKYRLQLLHFKQRMERMFQAVEKLATTPEERSALMKAHIELESVSQGCRDRISAMGKISQTNTVPRSGNVVTASNHRETWPASHLQLLEDPKISDEQAAKQLGRTVGAVRQMRYQVKKH
jgi:ParB family chromosome partitioning protein